jgi:dihydrofolate reductase
MTRTISIIAAVAAGNGAIGFKGQMPPKMVNPEDRAIFARKTAGGVLLCGNTTADTLSRVVIRRDEDTRTVVSIQNGVFLEFEPGFDSWEPWTEIGPYSIEAVAAHYPDRNIWVCGGSRLYAEAMRHPLVTEMHLSFMDCEPEADAFFPRIEDGAPGTIVTGTLLNGDASIWQSLSRIPINGGRHSVYRRP